MKRFKSYINESVELDESITKMSDARLKFHVLKNVPHGSYTKKELSAEHDRRRKTQGPAYMAVKPSLNEENIDEAVNAKKIAADHDAGHSIDVIVQKHLNKKGDNKDEILKAIQAHRWNKRMKKEEAKLDEISQETLRNYHAKAALDLRKKREKLDKGTLTSKDYKQGQNRVTGLNRAANKMEEVELDEALDHEGLKKDFGDSDAKVHSVATAHRAPAEVIGHKSFKTDKGKVPVLKHYDRENFEHKEVPLRKGQKLVHDGDEHYHGYSDTHGHFRVHEDDMNKSHLRESMEELDEARKSDSYQFTHKPGDAESEKRLADLKKSVKGTGKRVVLQGRLGKDNPNAHKYSKDAPSAKYKDGKRVNSDVSGKSGGHSHQRIQKADAAHHDVYVYDRNESVELDELSKKTLGSYVKKASSDVDNTSYQAGDTVNRMARKKLIRQTNKRLAGIEKATDRLTKEEVEQIDEISKATLRKVGGQMLRKGLSDDPKADKHMKYANLASAKLYPNQYKNSPLKAKVPATEEVELDEAKLSSQQRDRLDHLINMAAETSSPEYMGNENTSKYINLIKKEFGDYVAKQVDGGLEKMHWGRDNQDHGHDKLASRQWSSKFKGGPRVTAAGKMNKQDVSALKNRIKSDKRAWGGVAKKANLPEELELDELNKSTLGSYIKKANVDAMKHAQKSGEYNNPDQPKHFSKAMDRMRGVKKATDKLVAKEEVEELDELKKSTLGSYVKKAAGSMAGKTAVAAAQASSSMGKSSPDIKRGIVNRMKGITRATDKLTKEEADLEEKLVGGQKKLDHNKNGKIDSHDFHLMRKKKMKEEVEGLDEISRDLARRYIRKIADKTNTGELSVKQVEKRRPGLNLAGKKAYPSIAGEPKVRATD